MLGLLCFALPIVAGIYLKWVWWAIVLVSLAAYLVYEQVWYLRIKGNVAGPVTVPPLIGHLVTMVRDPIPFWEKQRAYAMDGFSTNSMFGSLMVYITNGNLGRRVFCNLEDFILYAHPNAKYLLGPENMIYMTRETHKEFRRLWLPGLFNKNCLDMYLNAQEQVTCHVLNKLVA